MGTILYDPFSLEAREDPYPVYRRLRAEAPVYHDAVNDLWVLTRFDDVQAAARDWGTFSNAEGDDLDRTNEVFGTGETGNFIASDPPVHTRMRKMVGKLFTPKAIRAAYEPKIRAEVGRLLDRLEEDDDEVDLAGGFANALPAMIVGEWLGFPRRDVEMVAGTAARFVAREVGNPGMPASAVPALEELRAYVRAAVGRCRKDPSGGVISYVLNGAEEEGFAREAADEMAANMAFFFYVAGTETTAALIGNALLALAEHPDQREVLLRDPDLMPQAVEELLRYESPLQHDMRVATRETEVRGSTIPAGARVMLLLGSANRDEDRWERSEELDVTREPQRHLAFGEGIHHCLGAPLARLEAPIALSAFLRRWPGYEISGPATRLPGFSVRGLKELPARL